MPGIPAFVALIDVSHSGAPEIIAGVHLPGSRSSVLIYGECNDGYELMYNDTSIGSIALARPYLIDYYGNGSEYLLVPGRGSLLIGWEAEGPVAKGGSPFSMGYMGFACGDVNGFGRPDIVHHRSGGFAVLENKGGGEYLERSLGGNTPSVIDEIKIGDVDGDGANEIVMVGCCPPNPSLSVWKCVEGEYEEVWSYFGGTIQSVDIGDMDGDGIDEIVTAAECMRDPGVVRGLSVWKYQPEIADGGRVVQPSGFSRVWEDQSTIGGVEGMMAVRVAPSGSGGAASIFASESHTAPGSDQGTLMYVVAKNTGYSSTRILLWSGHTQYSLIDVWPTVRVSEFLGGFVSTVLGSLSLLAGCVRMFLVLSGPSGDSPLGETFV